MGGEGARRGGGPLDCAHMHACMAMQVQSLPQLAASPICHNAGPLRPASTPPAHAPTSRAYTGALVDSWTAQSRSMPAASCGLARASRRTALTTCPADSSSTRITPSCGQTGVGRGGVKAELARSSRERERQAEGDSGGGGGGVCARARGRWRRAASPPSAHFAWVSNLDEAGEQLLAGVQWGLVFAASLSAVASVAPVVALASPIAPIHRVQEAPVPRRDAPQSKFTCRGDGAAQLPFQERCSGVRSSPLHGSLQRGSAWEEDSLAALRSLLFCVSFADPLLPATAVAVTAPSTLPSAQQAPRLN